MRKLGTPHGDGPAVAVQEEKNIALTMTREEATTLALALSTANKARDGIVVIGTMVRDVLNLADYAHGNAVEGDIESAIYDLARLLGHMMALNAWFENKAEESYPSELAEKIRLALAEAGGAGNE